MIVRLLNLIEDLSADLRDAQVEIQRLRDEVNRLKGEQGKPNIKANQPKLTQSDHSSEKERRKSKPREKVTLQIHREQMLEVDKASLPADAEFKGYEDVVVQDIIFRADNVCFHKEKYWAASTGQTYLAELPHGYEGQLGPGIKALTVTLYFGGGIVFATINAASRLAHTVWGLAALRCSQHLGAAPFQLVGAMIHPLRNLCQKTIVIVRVNRYGYWLVCRRCSYSSHRRTVVSHCRKP